MTEPYDEFLDIKAKALTVADNISNGHNYPIDEIIDLTKRLSAYALRLRFLAGELEKPNNARAKEAAIGLDNLVGSLKFQIKEHMEREYWGGRNVS